MPKFTPDDLCLIDFLIELGEAALREERHQRTSDRAAVGLAVLRRARVGSVSCQALHRASLAVERSDLGDSSDVVASGLRIASWRRDPRNWSGDPPSWVLDAVGYARLSGVSEIEVRILLKRWRINLDDYRPLADRSQGRRGSR